MSESHPVEFKSYLRRCVYIFIAAVCMISLMIGVSFLPEKISWTTKVAAILAIACVNAFLVAGYLMHLLSEKKMVYTILGFTALFFAGLLGLTIYAMHDFPTGTQLH